MRKIKTRYEFSNHERAKMLRRIAELVKASRDFKVEDDRGGSGAWIITITRAEEVYFYE